jgi:hypothetical protein
LATIPEDGQNTPGGYIPLPAVMNDNEEGLISVINNFACVGKGREMAMVVLGSFPGISFTLFI